MSYEVLALKWRPQTFSELIGQTTVQKTLTNSLKNNRLHPVCLFTGPRGTGKTSTARILAKTLRCQHKKDVLQPCGKCKECQLIQKGQSLDVMEIDGASNNGVEAVRALRDTLSYMPSTGEKKIYIIDEVHMLSVSAFNALLKTLEEPPSHVLFIMATTEVQKIPLTVLSRCQKFDFRLIPSRLIKNHLQKIAKGEGISIDDRALWLIARHSEGSLRDGQSLLDQIATFCNKKINPDKVIEILSLTGTALLFSSLKILCQRDERQMVHLIDEQRNSGLEPQLFLQSLIEGLRDLLVLKKNPDNIPPLVNRSQQEIEELKACSEGTSYEDLHFLFDLTLKGERDIAFCHDSQLALEVFLLKLAAAPKLESLIPLNPLLESESDLPSPSKKLVSAIGSPDTEDALNTSLKTPVQIDVSKEREPHCGPGTDPSTTVFDGSSELKKMETLWFQFINFLKTRSPSLAGTVANLSLKELSGDTFIFYEPSFEYIKAKITDPKNLEFLISELNLFLKSSKKFQIRFQNSTGSEQPVTLEKLQKRKENEELFELARQDLFVQKLGKTFKADIESVQLPSANSQKNT